MRRLRLLLPLACLALLLCGARAETPGLSISAPGEINPGRPVVLSFSVPEDGECVICLTDEASSVTLAIAEGRPVKAGYNSMYWNGTCGGLPVPEGEWLLVLGMNGATVSVPVTIGRMVPCLISVSIETETPAEDDGAETPETPGTPAAEEGDTVLIRYYATEAGSLRLEEEEPDPEAGAEPLVWDNIAAGEGSVSFQAEMTPGEHTLLLTLAGVDGTASEPVRFALSVLEKPDPNAIPTAEPLPDYLREKAESGFTPLHESPSRGTDQTLNYWTLPMDITDEEAVWKALTAPITVLDNGKKNAERTQVVLRAEPSADADGVGVATCISQGVHVVERGEEWSLVECYSSSFHDSPVLNWNALVQGYVPTAYLKTVRPSQNLGLVVDKLTQRLYVFKDGNLFSTLLVSTGVANARQPYNETRSGEFLLVSKVGEFASDNMRCALAIRFNDGDLLHEVPYFVAERGRDYSVNEAKLGQKASHGCIRVQRQATPEGVSQKWLWNNYEKNTRIFIWEDWQGRQVPVPADDTPLYCVKKRVGNYHTTDRCSALKGKNVISLTYGQLEAEEFLKLKACPLCAAPQRRDAIREMNALYAAGGDHDPVLTEARKNCPRKLKGK